MACVDLWIHVFSTFCIIFEFANLASVTNLAAGASLLPRLNKPIWQSGFFRLHSSSLPASPAVPIVNSHML